MQINKGYRKRDKEIICRQMNGFHSVTIITAVIPVFITVGSSFIVVKSIMVASLVVSRTDVQPRVLPCLNRPNQVYYKDIA